jgi:hypothetical protein
VDVAEASAGALDLFDGEVRGFDLAVARAGSVVSEDLGAPSPQRLGESALLDGRFGFVAPGDRPVERGGGFGRVVGEIDVAYELLSVNRPS